MDNENKILEGEEKLDELVGETSAPETTETAEAETIVPDLTSTPVPTETEIESDTPVATEDVVEENVVEQEKEVLVREDENSTETPALKTFTQNQVNDIVGKTRVDTREKTFKYIYDRYGVKGEDELDELIGNSQRLDTLKEQYEAEKGDWNKQLQERDNELLGIKEKVALMESGIDSSRYEDAKLILKGKGLEVNLENIKGELATHPEWNRIEKKNFVKTGAPEVKEDVVSKISVLGNDTPASTGEDEKSYAFNKYFKI